MLRHRSGWIARGVLAAITLGALTPPASATTFTVNSTLDQPDANLADVLCASASGFCTLRAAIQEANDTPGADTILVPAGTYALTVPGAGEDAAATGDLDITGQVSLHPLEGPFGAATTVIDAGGLDRIFDLRAGSSSSYLQGVTVRGGAETDGGAIRVGNALGVVLSYLQVEANTASNGFFGRGGGIHVSSGGSMDVRESAIVGNSVCAAGICFGGGIYSEGSVSIRNSIVYGNTGDDGGGILIQAGDAELNNVTVAGNSATSSKGGIGAFGGSILIANSILADNTAPSEPDCGATLVSGGYNLIESSAGCTVLGNATGVLTGVDPDFEPYELTEVGTGAVRLGPGSPALDAGNPDDLGSYPECEHEDQRFEFRTAPCDLGAHERTTICPTLRVSAGCKQAVPGKSSLLIKTRDDSTKDQIKWSWVGAATTDAELGDGSTGYALCGYLQHAPNAWYRSFDAVAPAGGTCGTQPCWKDGVTGLAYKDKAADPDGLTAIKAKAGVDGKAKIAVQGKGTALLLADPPYAPFSSAVAIQLRKDDGTCWEAVYTAPKKDAAGLYQSKN